MLKKLKLAPNTMRSSLMIQDPPQCLQFITILAKPESKEKLRRFRISRKLEKPAFVYLPDSKTWFSPRGNADFMLALKKENV